MTTFILAGVCIGMVIGAAVVVVSAIREWRRMQSPKRPRSNFSGRT